MLYILYIIIKTSNSISEAGSSSAIAQAEYF